MQSLSKENIAIQKIIWKIYTQNPTHYEDLMIETGLSRKTISRYLTYITTLSQEVGIKLERKRNYGIFFSGNLENIGSILTKDFTELGLSISNRRDAISIELLIRVGPLTIDELSEKFFVSRSTLNADLKYIRSRFSQDGIELIGNEKGLQIAKIDEYTRRKLLSKLINNYSDGEQEDTRLLEFIQLGIGNFCDNEHNSLIHNLSKVLGEFEAMIGVTFSDYDYQSLMVHLFIMIGRCDNTKESPQVDLDYSLEILEETKVLCGLLNETLNLELPLEELEYLNVHIMAIVNKKMTFADRKKIDNSAGIETIIELLKSLLDSYDEELISGLALHLVPALRRFNLGLQLHNPYTEEIAKVFPPAFNEARTIIDLLEKELQLSISIDEIAYVALHIQAYYERQKKTTKLNLVIACNSGYGTAQLIKQRILGRFGDKVNITRVLSIREIQQQPITEDLIISTVPLEIEGTPIVQMSLFTEKKGFAFLDKRIKDLEIKKRKSWFFMNLISRDCIFILKNEPIRNYEQCIGFITDKLIRSDNLREDAKQSAINRELISSTAIANIHVAIPHTETEFVSQPVISVLICKNGIDWLGSEIKIVFFIALNETVRENISDIYEYFNDVLENKTLLNKLIHGDTADQIISILRGEE
ncbi:TPA: transcription antiterminator [Enterococcus faecium]